MAILEINTNLLNELYKHNILLSYNSPPPNENGYGWLKIGQQIEVKNSLIIEENCGIYGGTYFPLVGGIAYAGLCSMGAFSYSYSSLPEPLVVGRYCSISQGLRFLDSSHPTNLITTSAITFLPHNLLFSKFITQPLLDNAKSFDIQGGKTFPVIGHDVWIGANVTIALGIKIGTGAIVASNSVVTKDVPSYSVVAGNPAEIKKLRFPEEIVFLLLKTEWWNYSPLEVFSLNLENPLTVCEAIQSEKLSLFQPKVVKILVP